jgi:hypothetical protein
MTSHEAIAAGIYGTLEKYSPAHINYLLVLEDIAM